MKVLFSTERVPAVSKDMRHIGGGPAQTGVAWFEMVLHDKPADDCTWEGSGQTVAYWHENFARMVDPRPWTVSSGFEGVPAAVIPDELVDALPGTARISFVWTFTPAEVVAKA